MVATIAPLSAGKMAYYTKHYYLDGQAQGEWLATEAARSLGLGRGGVKPKPFERLLLGFHPTTEERLVQNAGAEKRQVGWDVQFGVDKSISVLHALVPEAREAITTSIREAAQAVIREVLEPQFLESRRGQGGRLRERASVPVAGFLHENQPG